MLLTFSKWCTYDLLHIPLDSSWGPVLEFFIYDSVKIIFLLFFMIFIIGILRSYISTTKVKQWIGKRGLIANVFAAVFGALTPFCSCSSIPIFLSFLKAGVPLGATFSFLITSPLINEYLVVLMIGFFGWKITGLYVLSGLCIGIISGAILGKMNLEHLIEKDILSENDTEDQETVYSTFAERISYGFQEATSIVKKIWKWVMLGVLLGALIHNFVPEETVQKIISNTGIFSVPIATILGVPMYGSCAAIVPIAVVLFQKGIPLGTALAFMMAIAALSLPEAIMLRRSMKLKLIAIFFAITTLAIMFTGYIFNALPQILF